MANLSQIQPNTEVIGADGVHVGTVDHVDGDRLKMTKKDSSDGRHHFIDGGLIASTEGGKIRLSANADVAIMLEEDDVFDKAAESDRLDEGLEETFPASDPVAAKHIS
jgi:hypothetical protein